MYVNHDDLQAIASDPNTQGNTILSAMDDEVVSLKCKVCVAFLIFIFGFCLFFFFFELIFNDADTVQQARYRTIAKED